MALDATVSGTSSNSYATRAEADTYFADRLNSTDWTGASSANKDAALVTATRRLDEEQFLGEKASSTQALKWPRVNVYDEDGIPFDSDEIPARVKEATYLTALELLKADFLAESPMGNYKSLKVGSLAIEQFSPRSSGRLPSEAMRLLSSVMVSAGGARLIRA